MTTNQKYKASIFDLLQEFVNYMQFPCRVYKVISSTPATGSYEGTNILLNVDDIYHVIEGMVVEIGGNNYTVVDWNESYLPADDIMQLTVNDGGSGKPIVVVTGTPLVFNVPPPTFAYGTLNEQNEAVSDETQKWNKYPLIWCKAPVEETMLDDSDEAHERISDLEIYFLTNNDESKSTINIYENYVRPMTRLKDCFIEVINTDSGNYPVGSVDKNDMDIKTREITRVAVKVAGKGKDISRSMFSDPLSGVAIRFQMKLFWPDSNIFLG